MDQFVVFMIGLLGSNLVLSTFFFFLGKEAGRREKPEPTSNPEHTIKSLEESIAEAQRLANFIEAYQNLTETSEGYKKQKGKTENNELQNTNQKW